MPKALRLSSSRENGACIHGLELHPSQQAAPPLLSSGRTRNSRVPRLSALPSRPQNCRSLAQFLKIFDKFVWTLYHTRARKISTGFQRLAWASLSRRSHLLSLLLSCVPGQREVCQKG